MKIFVIETAAAWGRHIGHGGPILKQKVPFLIWREDITE